MKEGEKMKIWTCTEFKGNSPVGTAAVVVASNENQACRLMEDILRANGLPQEIAPENLTLISTFSARAILLCDGNY